MRPMKRAEIVKKCNLNKKEFDVNIKALKERNLVKILPTEHYKIVQNP